jgi:exodeoxyribonuclease-3
LQELKAPNEKFPYLELEDCGYNILVNGQKTYNGVAILSKFPIDEKNITLAGYDIDNDDAQARYAEVTCNIGQKLWRFIVLYVPNGQALDSDKFQYKLKFYQRLHKYFTQLQDYQENIIIAGDFNVANTDLDVYDPASLEGKICFSLPEKKALRKITNLGFFDSYRVLSPYKKQFSWWDYRAGSYNKNFGLRIDYIFANSYALDHLQDSVVLEKYRKLAKPSDHAPLLALFAQESSSDN